ncbi:MAG: RcpC/CpaB family pilus assembly protein, partial [Actinomycetota bacterium]|nr:RcpC/CpaB family pilus assembly protein [Actinomycetota bacterium]
AQGEVDIPPGSQQVAISLEPQRAVGGQVKPGDTVGFFASFEDQTHLILHKLLVTNVRGGGQTSGAQQADQAAPGGELMITLAVDAAQAERVVFAAEHGTIWLSAEPSEASEAGTRVQTKETIYQ